MQELVNTIRSTGASNVLMLGGVEYANSLSDWLRYRPTDPMGNLVAGWHAYNFNLCKAGNGCWNGYIAPVSTQVPLVAGEIGENDCREHVHQPVG